MNPWASNTIKIMVDPISMIFQPLGKQWGLFSKTSILFGCKRPQNHGRHREPVFNLRFLPLMSSELRFRERVGRSGTNHWGTYLVVSIYEPHEVARHSGCNTFCSSLDDLFVKSPSTTPSPCSIFLFFGHSPPVGHRSHELFKKQMLTFLKEPQVENRGLVRVLNEMILLSYDGVHLKPSGITLSSSSKLAQSDPLALLQPALERLISVELSLKPPFLIPFSILFAALRQFCWPAITWRVDRLFNCSTYTYREGRL